MKKFNEMTKKEKKDFLSMDLIERIIRLEQRVSASFGEFIHYYDTHYFKNLSEKERKEFVKYITKNKRKKYIIASFISFLVMGSILLKGAFTGRVVYENINISTSFFENVFLLLFIVIIIVFSIYLLSKRKRHKRIKGYFDVIDTLYIRKIRK